MKRDDIIRMAVECQLVTTSNRDGIYMEALERFAELVAAAEREKVARWIMERGYATGHGDTVEDLLREIDWQAAEREREMCASVAESYEPTCDTCPSGVANAIRSRGEE
jgi:hypothetical protein